jgi:hypothetical protein
MIRELRSGRKAGQDKMLVKIYGVIGNSKARGLGLRTLSVSEGIAEQLQIDKS